MAGAEALVAEQGSQLRVAASLTVAEHLLPGWIAALHRESPDVILAVEVTNSSKVLARVSDGSADVGFVEGNEPGLDMMSTVVVRSDRLVVVVDTAHPWSRRQSAVLGRELAAAELIVREPGSGTREVLDNALSPWGGPRSRLELGSTASILAAARRGEGPAVLSALAVAEDISAGFLVAVPTEDIDLTRSLRAVWLKSRPWRRWPNACSTWPYHNRGLWVPKEDAGRPGSGARTSVRVVAVDGDQRVLTPDELRQRWVKVIDQDKCIGCHACTTACKSENEVPLGVTRTYVKSVEVGTFPQVRRVFQVTRCNQCTDAPCTAACPTRAMYRRPDGIVDFDKSLCIGCKACIAACPYDAIFINPDDNSAEKCNLCAHRLEVGLEPACVVVCPTEAILVGDLNDPRSKVAQDRSARAGHRPAAGEGHPAGPVLQGSAPGDARPPGGPPARRRPVRLGGPGR